MTTVLAIQSLDVVSVNLWQMLISICNLLIIFLIIKKISLQARQSGDGQASGGCGQAV